MIFFLNFLQFIQTKQSYAGVWRDFRGSRYFKVRLGLSYIKIRSPLRKLFYHAKPEYDLFSVFFIESAVFLISEGRGVGANFSDWTFSEDLQIQDFRNFAVETRIERVFEDPGFKINNAPVTRYTFSFLYRF